MKIAYYNWRNDKKWRRLRNMKIDVSKCGLEWSYQLNTYCGEAILVGDKKLIELDDDVTKWGVSEHYGPTFLSYDAALEWLKGEEEMPTFKNNTYDKVLTHLTSTDDCALTFGFSTDTIKKHLTLPPIKRIEQNTKNGGSIYTTVIWEDNSDATVVKCAEDDIEDLYFAVASAIAIKLFGSNSAFKRIIDEKADILEEESTEMEFSINMNNLAENIRKAFKYRGGYNG